MGRESATRGATQLRLLVLINKKSADDTTEKTSQPHFMGYVRSTEYILCLDNGGNSGVGYSENLSPCGSKNHSAPTSVQASHRPCSLYRKSWRLLLLFTAMYVFQQLISNIQTRVNRVADILIISLPQRLWLYIDNKGGIPLEM
jgi:hypothetical protein